MFVKRSENWTHKVPSYMCLSHFFKKKKISGFSLQPFSTSSGSRNNAVQTSLFLSSLFVDEPSFRSSTTGGERAQVPSYSPSLKSFHPQRWLCTASAQRFLSHPLCSHLIHPPRFRGMPGGGGRGTCDCPGGTGGGGGYPAGGRPIPGGGPWPGGMRGGGGGG